MPIKTTKINNMPAIIADDILVFNPKTSLSAYANTLSGSFTYPSGKTPCSIMINNGKDIFSSACHAWLGYPETVIYRYKDGKFGIGKYKSTSEIPNRTNVLWAIGGLGLLDKYSPKEEGFCKIVKGGKTYDYSDVLRKTNHTVLGIKDSKCYLVYCTNMTGEQINEYAKKSGFKYAIMMDGGHIAAINGSESYAKINTKQMQGYALQGISTKPETIQPKPTQVTTQPTKATFEWIQDAGHGGKDPGATAKGNIEKNYNLEAAIYVNKRLNELGIGSDCSRTADTTLDTNDRVNKIKKYKYCISHHFNAGGGSGVETIHSIHSDGKFENLIINEFKDAKYPIRPKSVFSKKNSRGTDYYYMHRETGNCKTTIVEYDFVDGSQSEKIKDKSYREGMYECVVRAICKYKSIVYRPSQSKIEEKDTSTDESLYKIQVGAFKSKESADKLKESLADSGYPDAFIVKK